jgi:hypothetical protein
MKLGGATRQIAIWTAIVAAVAVVPGTATADKSSPDDHFGHDGRHGRGAPALAVRGRAMSKGEKEAWAMDVRGRTDKAASDASGVVRFGHRGPKGSDGLMGEIKCLSRDSAGVIQLTGTVKRSASRPNRGGDKAPKLGTEAQPNDEAQQMLDDVAALDPEPGQADNKPGDDKKGPKFGRGELAGQDFAFTIDVPGNPQRFSVPQLGKAGTLSACSAGGTTVPVTRGGFRSTETQGH